MVQKLSFWVDETTHSILLIFPMKNCFTFNLLDTKL